jgi:hypothetical protein
MMDPTTRRKKKEEVQEMNNASKETTPDSPGGGGDDEVDQEENEGEENKQEHGEVTPPKDPITEAETSKKRKVSPKKPSAQKKSRENKPQLQTVLTVDDIDLIIAAVSDTSEDILQQSEAKQETMFDKIEAELKGVQQGSLFEPHSVYCVIVIKGA